MRNAEFVPLVMQLARRTPKVVQVTTLAEAGNTLFPLGFVISGKSSESRWQAIQQLAEGEKHEHPALDIEGLPPPWDDSEILTGDAWLAAVIGRAQLRMVERIVCWSQRPDGSGEEGVTVHFRNGAKTFLRRL